MIFPTFSLIFSTKPFFYGSFVPIYCLRFFSSELLELEEDLSPYLCFLRWSNPCPSVVGWVVRVVGWYVVVGGTYVPVGCVVVYVGPVVPVVPITPG
jgi:hypothetical protein